MSWYTGFRASGYQNGSMKWSFELLAGSLGAGHRLFLPYFSRLAANVVYLLLFLESEINRAES